MKTLLLTVALLLAEPCSGGDKPAPAYELGVVTAVSNEGRAIDHSFVMQTECCNYTIQNWHMFSGLTIGGHNDLYVKDEHAYIRVGQKIGKARIFRAEQREGFDPALYVVFDPKGNEYRTGDTTGLPDGWVVMAIDEHNRIQSVPESKVLPGGWRLVHGLPGKPLPPILRAKS